MLFDLHFFSTRGDADSRLRYTVSRSVAIWKTKYLAICKIEPHLFTIFICVKFVDRLKLHFKRNMKYSTEFWAHVVITVYKLLRIYPKFYLWIIPRTMIHLTRFFPPAPVSPLIFASAKLLPIYRQSLAIFFANGYY